ncbi:MAG: polysaccharide biosynthesis C-terminal domain-containing protein [Aeromicrobium erythreum]
MSVLVRRPSGLLGAGGVMLGAGAAGALVNLVAALLVARVLGPSGAGAYFLVVAAVIIVAGTAELGVDTGLVRFVSAARAVGRPEDVAPLVRSALPPVLATAAVVVAVGGGLAALGVGPVAPWAVVVAAVAAAQLSLVAVLLAVTRGFADSLTYPALQSLLLPVGRLVGVLVVAATGGGAAWMVLSWAAPLPFVLALATLVVVRHLRRARREAAGRTPQPDVGSRLWRFSAVRGVAAAVEVLLEWVDVLLVGALAGPAAAGVYAVVTRCVRASEVVQQAARVVVGPAVSGAFARGDRAGVARLQELVTTAMIWTAWPFFVLLAVFGDVVLGWFGPGFVHAAPALAVLAGALAVQTAAGAVQSVLLMAGRSRWQLYDKSGSLVLMVALDLALVPVLGVLGAAIAWAVTIVADTAVVVLQVRRGLEVRAGSARPLLAAGLVLSVVAVPAVLARWWVGPSPVTLLGTVVVLGAAHVVVAWRLRERLGLPDLLAARPD